MRFTPGTYLIGPYLQLHGRVYRATGGAVGRHVGGRKALMLHTVGRKSGKPRTVALTYAQDGDAYVVVGSFGGAAQHPAWFLNLEANPRVEVQIGRDRRPATAHVARGEERERLWRLVNETNRGLAPLFHRGAVGRYDVYQGHTTRELPVVVLTPDPEPTGGPEPAGD